MRNLLSSFGRRFATLDEYLGHFELHADPVDQPWCREARPGVDERMTTITPRCEPQTFTREQLLQE